MQLDVLPIGDVRQTATEFVGDVGHHAQLRAGHRTAVAAYPEHEEFVIEFFRRQAGRLAAGDSRAALGVQAPPTQPAPQVVFRDRRETVAGVDLFDSGTHVQPAVGGLEDFVGIQRLARPQRPLALVSWCAGRLGPPWATRGCDEVGLFAGVGTETLHGSSRGEDATIAAEMREVRAVSRPRVR